MENSITLLIVAFARAHFRIIDSRHPVFNELTSALQTEISSIMWQTVYGPATAMENLNQLTS